jgi:hypothetical protein
MEGLIDDWMTRIAERQVPAVAWRFVAAAASSSTLPGAAKGEACSRSAATAASSPTSRPSWWSPRVPARRSRTGGDAGRERASGCPSSRRFRAGGDGRRHAGAGLSGPRGRPSGAVRDLCSRRQAFERFWRSALLRRPGDEECRRLRRSAPAGRQPGHARRRARGIAEGAAAAGGREEPAFCHRRGGGAAASSTSGVAGRCRFPLRPGTTEC